MSSYYESDARRRWRATLRRTLVLLLVWLAVGPVAGILLVDRLNAVRFGDMPLGFWISLQGAVYVFVVLIFVYAFLSDRAERSSD